MAVIAPKTKPIAQPQLSPARKEKKLPLNIAAANAKSNFLRMLATVSDTGEYVITKRGKPVAKLIPFEPKPKKDIYGCMAGTAEITGDIMSPLPPEEWGSLY